ncbi:class I SAM-dependent methyltransferase [Halobium salinum]|uniref:Class I SAM-dependent methyltransferase n=1 Tax=Halobium salinum TaxID=1364940 RepID=A0ABD5PD51_9EURY|nr:class I SAM-dependent methyltransferase family protein [Halobium salinum]
MDVPCVRVPREEGERARRALADADLVDRSHGIVVEDGEIFIPVTDPAAVPDEFAVVDHEAPAREPQRMPADLLGFEPSYERLGDVVILDEDDPERAREIAKAVVASDLRVGTVVNRASKVKGELRVRDWEVLVNARDAKDARPPTETVHREYGHEFCLDIATVYFSPRLATERRRVAEQVRGGEHAFDMFAGVGPFVVPMAARGAEVIGVDLNEAAVAYLRENATRNGVEERVTAIQGDVREVAPDYEGWADRVVMNLPHSADEFLGAAVTVAGDDCTLHYYDIQHEDDPFGPGAAAIRAAAEPEYDVEVVTEHVVRSYAPHEHNVCLDVRLTR